MSQRVNLTLDRPGRCATLALLAGISTFSCGHAKTADTPSESADSPSEAGSGSADRGSGSADRGSGAADVGSEAIGGDLSPVDDATPDVLFPPGSSVVNIKERGAKGDGVTDDTEAIRSAIADAEDRRDRTIYFPAGTYVVSDTLEWREKDYYWSNLNFQGQHRNKTIIRLRRSAPGFGDASSPKAVIKTASEADVSFPDGGGNKGFRNSIYDLTVDTGTTNPGAIAVDYNANNKGAIRNVTLTGSGSVGLNLSREWPGPAYVSNVLIKGFNVGIQCKYHYQYGITFEHITLVDQKQFGVYNDNNNLWIRDLRSTNSVPVIRSGKYGFVGLTDSTFQGGSSSQVALENTGGLFVRNLKTAGYKAAVSNDGALTTSANIEEFSSAEPKTLFDGKKTSLNLPVEEGGDFSESSDQWAMVTSYGAKHDDGRDDTEAIQAALNSGKATVFFPRGRFDVSKALQVPGSVRKIMGLETSLTWTGASSTTATNPFLFVQAPSAHPLIVSRLNIRGWINHSSSRTLILRDVGYASYQGAAGSSKVFGENAMMGRWRLERGQKAWVRQLNSEFQKDVPIINRGADLWIMGLKMEISANKGDSFTLMQTSDGGRTELLGALLYPLSGSAPASQPAFVSVDSEMSLSYCTNSSKYTWPVHVRETRNGVTRELNDSGLRQTPLFVGNAAEGQR